MNASELLDLMSALESPCCTDAERKYSDQIIENPEKAFVFDDTETLLRSQHHEDPDGIQRQN